VKILTYWEIMCTFVVVDSSGLMSQSGSGVTSVIPTDVSAADYLERLKLLRARCGLDNDASSRSVTDGALTLSDAVVGGTKAHLSTSHVLDGRSSTVCASAFSTLFVALCSAHDWWNIGPPRFLTEFYITRNC